MFVTIHTSSGNIVHINPNYVVSAELQRGFNSWKLLMVREVAYDTDGFDSKEAALAWFDEQFRKAEAG